MQIFYSWQSDTPNVIGRTFIRRALDEAVEILAKEMELCEAERPSVDQDTQGIMGSPAIGETIFEKIRKAQVVVFDVTLTGRTVEGKPLVNSNVSIELGFAHGHHGDHVLLNVMNTYYGPPGELPFDLQHRRWPLQYVLSPDSDTKTRNKVRGALVQQLVNILRQYAAQGPIPQVYEPIEAQNHPAAYWKEKELLVEHDQTLNGNEGVNLGWGANQALCYLRVWPYQGLPILSGQEMSNSENTAIQPLLGRAMGNSWDRNKYGTIAYSYKRAGDLIPATQVFKNREIWGTEGFTLKARDDSDFDFVPTIAFEEGMRRSLPVYLQTAFERLEYGERANVEAGLVNVRGFRLAMPNGFFDRFWGPIYEDHIRIKAVVERNDPTTWDAFLLKLFGAIFDATGTTRPENLGGFPGAPEN